MVSLHVKKIQRHSAINLYGMLLIFAALFSFDTHASDNGVQTAKELRSAAGKSITITTDIELDSPLQLAPGTHMRGIGNPTITFTGDTDGIELSKNNTLEGLNIVVAPNARAIFNNNTTTDLGEIHLQDLKTVGQIQIIADANVTRGALYLQHVFVEVADTRERERLAQSRVSVLQGAIHIQNLQPDPESIITATLIDVSTGSVDTPIKGSGIVVGGASDAGGRLLSPLIQTGPVYIDGGLPAGTADKIAGGVFVLYGSFIEKVLNTGPVVTYGVNNMVLDNWGTVDHWVAEADITSYGPSGIGFVNFGSLGYLQINGPIETFGIGARGFNVYSGIVYKAMLDSVTTHGNAAVGIAISKSIGQLTVRKRVQTEGASGPSLVMGKIVSLPADGLSILPGAEVGEIVIEGGILSTGDNVVGYRNTGAWVQAMRVDGTIQVLGEGSDAIQLSGGAVTPITNIDAKSSYGAAIRVHDASITSLLGVSASGPKGDLVAEGPVRIGTSANTIEALRATHRFTIEGTNNIILEQLPYTAWSAVLRQRLRPH